MKCKLDVFTIFIILLVILVLFIMINKWFTIKETKETFIDFNKDNAENSSITTYIPQYSTDRNRTLIHLYDNLYFDHKNGAVIEVQGDETRNASDLTGNSITQLTTIPRDGRSYTSIEGRDINSKAIPSDSIDSKITTTNATYDEHTFKTITKIVSGNHRYQFFYYSWNTQTFIHLFKFSESATTTTPEIPAYKLQYIKSYMMNPTDGLKYTITATPASSIIPSPTNPITFYTLDDGKNKTSSFLSNYLTGTVKVFQITPLVFYDIANGNIIVKDSGTGIKVYDRGGGEKATPTNTGIPSQLTGQPTIFMIASDKSGMVLVTSFNQNTIISVIISNYDSYKIAATQRFNKTQPVNDLASDPDNAAPTTAPATTPPGGWDEWNKKFNNKWNDQYDPTMRCGTDKSCWYWFFKALPSLNDKNDMYDSNNGESFFSDDYFLKTEAVPPVCSQCPNCSNSGTGACTSCGGHGGSGTNISSCSPVDLHLTPILSTKYTDNLGNIYIAVTDNSGNKSYRLEGKMSAGETSTAASSNNVSGVANNAINTAGGLVGTAGNLAGGLVGTAGNLAASAGSGAVNLLKDTGSGAVDLLKDTGSGAVDLLKDTGSGAINLLKDAGSGIANLGSGGLQMQGSQYNSSGGVVGGVGSAGGGIGPSQLGSVSDKTFGKMSGQTPVDNYSYYGALQSKGGNFMPVTADFSSFRK
jgi:hypothetical protein